MAVVETVPAGHGDLPLGLPCWLATHKLDQYPIFRPCRAIDEAEGALQALAAHMKRAIAAADFASVLSALRSAASVRRAPRRSRSAL